jgi:hypothetical protein
VPSWRITVAWRAGPDGDWINAYGEVMAVGISTGAMRVPMMAAIRPSAVTKLNTRSVAYAPKAELGVGIERRARHAPIPEVERMVQF